MAEASFNDAPQELDTNLKEFGLLNFLKTEKGQKFLRFRFLESLTGLVTYLF